jgi:hypothetical protein
MRARDVPMAPRRRERPRGPRDDAPRPRGFGVLGYGLNSQCVPAPGAAGAHEAICGFGANIERAGFPLRQRPLSRHRARCVALCVGLDTCFAAAAGAQIGTDQQQCAPRTPDHGHRVAQVTDRSVQTGAPCKLARKLLRLSAGWRMHEARSSEDESGGCLGSG